MIRKTRQYIVNQEGYLQSGFKRIDHVVLIVIILNNHQSAGSNRFAINLLLGELVLPQISRKMTWSPDRFVKCIGPFG